MSGKADQIRLIAGKRYDTSALEARLIRVSWTAGDGTGHEGYRWRAFFHSDGTYLGPDQHGIEPTLWLVGEEPAARVEGGAE